ncbi:MgtC/SapB family protein [Bacillus atrophaeus]|uniref:MgtC/SapB family protein n=1 Tax=Bacillus atrophaeus TaxID=1452 RepID=UPI001C636080|nr:MgtC/SapB family protein [Bacillus atrophaeus]MCY8498409.1 MgtC/SapB family protein [Bacillus atrophaeus]MCY8812509.1 MgtC/SapB family protein [Bacillus atrophaeus]MCY8819207.1 MgtC/SapB family protein [Bacillus atrophaeus]MCY8826247.1 MgtC/SapB family protein [Bacillus atrophaeus]MCY8827243.1 MgtC/SapB family protein [Bacillus atrophaeus]
MLLDWYIEPDILVKLGIATLIGMIIGLERELKNKPLGLKTCIVIAVSSCMLTIVSINAAYHFPKFYRVMMDPLRLPAQIISGVGFIGAGVILRKSNDVISGLTTSAMIWGAAGLGLATGAGFYKEAFVSLLFILISVEILPWLIRKIGPDRLQEKDIRVRMSLSDKEKMTEILKQMKGKNIRIHSVRIDDLHEKEFPIMEVKIRVHKNRYTTDVYYDIKAIDGVVGVKCDTL